MPAPVPPSAAPVVPGYVLEELLGRGGSGQVWRARPRSGGPPVAVKVLVCGDPGRQEREAAMLGELDHPHLVRLHEVVRREVREGPAQVALVLDLLAGGSLAALLARRGRLRPGEVVTTVAPVAAALAHAHERGVVHGDLSPGNVVFTAEGRPVLTDLGTARIVGDTARAEMTPAYVDPVVARGGAPGPASDVFGVAAAAFHALTGVAPWNAAGPGATLTVAAAGELPDLALLAPEAPEELVRVVLRGLSAEPHLRGSAAAFALDLRHACRPEPVRLPVGGVPDEELGATGRGPRTELTHQVPGRRAGAGHSAPVPAGRLTRLRAGVASRWRTTLGDSVPDAGQLVRAGARRVGVGLLVLAGIAAGLAVAVWAGASWGGGPATDPVPAAEAAAVTSGADPTAAGTTATPAPEPPGSGSAASAPEPAASDPGSPGTGPSDAGSTGATAPVDPAEPRTTTSAPGPDDPVDAQGWADLVGGLYGQRAVAFAGAAPAALDAVYSADAPLRDRDRQQLADLAAAGQVLEGFSPRVVEVLEVDRRHPDEVRLLLVDTVPGYRVQTQAAAGAAVDEVTVPGRGEAQVRMVLDRGPDGWRIADASLVG
ncbi:serine/threonine-protein kinase [Modestobacter italicus]|uniref:serine/threonine-protein kinase n=1 Tax=Modestobacter italicus (strain DSM 44449 / CECT 9708 / BC 501) TaxID=2732864 RepID=UPI001C943AB4|nr:serine/threonine-protein kinase [Modestobacter italicus]